MTENIEEIKNRLRECEKRVEELSKKCESVENQRNFEYLNTRIHTRESSTLVFSTVAVSASLLLLGILIQMENPLNLILYLYSSSLNFSSSLTIYFSYKYFINSNNWLFWISILIIGFGIFYREITIWTIDKDDYDTLDCFGVYRYNQRNKLSSKARAVIVRFFFLLTLDAWLVYKLPHILSSQYILPFFTLDIIQYSIIHGTVFLTPIILYLIYRGCTRIKRVKISKERRISLLRINGFGKPFLVDFVRTSLNQKRLFKGRYRRLAEQIERVEDIMNIDYPDDILEKLYKIFVNKELKGRGLEWRFSGYMQWNRSFGGVTKTEIPLKFKVECYKEVEFDILGTNRNRSHKVWVKCKNNFSPVTIQEISKFLMEVQEVINSNNVCPDRIIFLSPACYKSAAVEYVREFGYVNHQDNGIRLELWEEFGKEFRRKI